MSNDSNCKSKRLRYLPDEVIDKVQIEFYSNLAQAAFKALTEDWRAIRKNFINHKFT
jgi:hypothetical protein